MTRPELETRLAGLGLTPAQVREALGFAEDFAARVAEETARPGPWPLKRPRREAERAS